VIQEAMGSSGQCIPAERPALEYHDAVVWSEDGEVLRKDDKGHGRVLGECDLLSDSARSSWG